MTTAVLRKTIGNYSESFVRQNILLLNNGSTVVVCLNVVNGAEWISRDRLLILGRWPRFLWRFALRRFFHTHNVTGAVVEFLDWACDMQPHLDALHVPFIALGHGYDVGRNLTRSGTYADKLLALSSAQAIILPSVFLKSLLEKHTRLPHHFLTAVPLGVDLNKFNFSSLSERNPTKTFVFIGRFVPKKGPLLLLSAFREAVRHGHDIYLRLAGTGPLLSAAQKFVHDSELGSRVKFLGVLNGEQVASELAEAVAVVQHSVTTADGNIEGLPVIMQESLAAGTPVISTLHSGIPEIIKSGYNGYLVDEFDYIGMANKMEALLALTPSEYAQMRCNCRSFAEAHLDNSKRISFMDECLRRAT